MCSEAWGFRTLWGRGDLRSPKQVEQSQDTWIKHPLALSQTNTLEWRTIKMTGRWWQWFLPSIWSEQEVCDGGQQLGQLRLDVGRLSDRVATEIEALQLGAGGQRLKICQRRDFCEFGLMKKSFLDAVVSYRSRYDSHLPNTGVNT